MALLITHFGKNPISHPESIARSSARKKLSNQGGLSLIKYAFHCQRGWDHHTICKIKSTKLNLLLESYTTQVEQRTDLGLEEVWSTNWQTFTNTSGMTSSVGAQWLLVAMATEESFPKFVGTFLFSPPTLYLFITKFNRDLLRATVANFCKCTW